MGDQADDPDQSQRDRLVDPALHRPRGEGARGFDAPGATYPHRDERGRCSFEALVDEHCATDPALVDLARIVHGADFADAIGDTPESAGLRAISQGFPLVCRDDHETLERATFLYDALY